MQIKIIFSVLLLSLNIFINACSSTSKPINEVAENVENTTVTNKTLNNSTSANNANNSNKEISSNNNSACYNFKRDGMKLLKSQTFAIDFEPYKKSCFVTFYGEEFSNPPLGSQFYIYKDGKEIFNFPDQFNGGNVLCWVDSVSFEDLNKDDLKDIIIVGKCGAKSEAYNENMVYINTGDDFTTKKDSNVELMDFSKVAEVKKYVEQHESMFSK